MTILDLKNGDHFLIQGVTLSREIGKRLADMGFARGVGGQVVRSALLGDPLQIHLLDYNVSIRKAEARGVEVELVQ